MSNIQNTTKTMIIKPKKKFVPMKPSHKKFKACFKMVETVFKNRAVETCFRNFHANKCDDDAGKDECPICYSKAHLVKLTCGHAYCETCLTKIKVVKAGVQSKTTQTFKCAMRCGEKMIKLPKHKIPKEVGAWVPEGQNAVGGKVRRTRGGCHDDAYWCSTKRVPRGIDNDDEIVFKKDTHKTNPKRKGKGEKPSISWQRWQECIIDHPSGPPEFADQWFKRGMNKGDWIDAIRRGYIEINGGDGLSESDEGSDYEEIFME